MIKNRLLAAAVTAAILIPTTAMATNGMFMMGNGTKANGRAGVGIAMHDSAISGADNPAAMVRVGNRVDFGIQIFDPDRTSEISGNSLANAPVSQENQEAFGQVYNPTATFSTTGLAGFPPDVSYADAFAWAQGAGPLAAGLGDGLLQMLNYKDDGNNDGPFYIPEGGFNYMLSDDMSIGLTVVGTGGMNTNYSNLNLFNGGNGEDSGINLEQVRILPTLSYMINDDHSVGISLQVAYQQFKAFGLDAFTSSTGPTNGQVSSAPNRMTDKGRDDAWGFGVSLGWQGDFLDDRLTVGVVYNSKIDMDEFDDYKGLLAEKGDLDVPENYGIGIAFKATEDLLLGFDVQQINYSDVDSIGENLRTGPDPAYGDTLFNPAYYFGNNNGSGFGWDDMTVYKLGAEYQWNDNLRLRAGWSHADQPISKDQTMFNILAPAVIEDHATIGMTYALPSGSEISMFYMHAFEEEVKGSNSIPAAFGGGEADIKMSQDAWGIAYGWNF